jgi:enoyl-CoA hydratase/carnithine racemase
MTDSSSPQVLRDDTDGIVTLTLNRPDKLNAVSNSMLDIIRKAVRDLAEDDSLRVMVITAVGKYFTAGGDIAALPVGDVGPGVSGSEFRRNYRRLHELFDEIEAIEKPVILAAQGPCLGIGVELSASCDFRIASSNAKFGLPEVRSVATLPGSGGISRLTRLIGPHWVKWMAMACQNINAQQALAAGLVHAVYEPDELQTQVRALALDLMSQPAEAVGVAKIVIDAAANSDRTTARDIDRLANTHLVLHEEHWGRVEAFRARSHR